MYCSQQIDTKLKRLLTSKLALDYFLCFAMFPVYSMQGYAFQRIQFFQSLSGAQRKIVHREEEKGS